ncbi:ribonuclease H-like domain-containing protein [Tanacetum coccineum]
MHDPKEPHFDALKHILQNVQETMDFGLQLYVSTTTSLVGYTDADWAGCPSTRSSTLGYCVFLGDNLLSWSAKRHHTLSRSSAEAKYRGVANVVARTTWLHNLLYELHSPLSTAALVFCDNVSAIYMSANPVQHQRMKHIEIDIHFVCDMVTAGHDELLWGAAWIYRASRDDSYMSYIERNSVRFGLTNHDFFFNWDDKRTGTNVLLAIYYLEIQLADFQVYKESSDSYICSMLTETSFATAQFTPGGLLYTQDGSNLLFVTTSSFLLLTYAKHLGADGMINSCGELLISGDVLVAYAKRQIDYIVGDNPMNMSYMVGFGENYPTRMRHRGSSVPSI